MYENSPMMAEKVVYQGLVAKCDGAWELKGAS